jgi:deazaflavin-dependent oxidoreductase (nitroreductase family)
MRIPEPVFAIINPTVRFLLRSPIHGFWSRSLMLITFTGRKTQRVYTTPVRYLKSGDAVWAFTSVENKWWRNLEGGATVSLRIQGKQGSYRAEAVTAAPDQVRAALREFLSHFPQDAPYYDIGLGPDRRPSESDLERASQKTIWVRAYPQ